MIEIMKIKNLSVSDFEKNLKTYQKLGGEALIKINLLLRVGLGWRAVTP